VQDPILKVIREKTSEIVSLSFSKLYCACIIDDSGDHTRHFSARTQCNTMNYFILVVYQ